MKPDWFASDTALCDVHIDFRGIIEDMQGLLQVDFANMYIVSKRLSKITVDFIKQKLRNYHNIFNISRLGDIQAVEIYQFSFLQSDPRRPERLIYPLDSFGFY